MTLTISSLITAVADHAAALGYFDRVNRHEPKSAPGNGVHCAIWSQRIQPIQASGLNSTSAMVVMNVRLYTPMLQEPQDDIDVNMIEAFDALMAAYTGGFTLGGLLRNIDLLGAHGVPLGARAGYQRVDQIMYRIMTIDVPMIVNDVWTQVS